MTLNSDSMTNYCLAICCEMLHSSTGFLNYPTNCIMGNGSEAHERVVENANLAQDLTRPSRYIAILIYISSSEENFQT